MKCIVCVKQVPDTSGKVAVKEDGTMDRASMDTITNPDDLNAIEAALTLKDQTGCEVVVVSMGPPPAEGMLRELLARGADRAVLVSAREFGGSDTFATSQILAAAIKKIGVEEGTRLLIFCPTFRDSSRQTALKSGVDLEKALDDLERVTGAKWKCLFRAHHLHTAGLALKESGRMLDMTGYEDMADLLLISDALITDYSSAAMDFCLLNRPIFLYQDDLEDYTHNDRGLHFSMEDSPFLVAKNQRELTELIEKTGPEQAAENCRAIEAFFGFHETGRATEKVCEKIMEWMA